MQTPERTDTPPGFRDVPWHWRDLLFGLAVPMLVGGSLSLVPWPAAWYQVWVPTTALLMAWWLAYPLRIARSRVGIPRLPRPRRWLIEAGPAFAWLLGVMTLLSAITLLLARTFGEAADGTRPFEGIAGSSSRVDPVSLVILAVLIAPVAEEVFFRGLFYNLLRRRMHPIFAASIQGVVFGLYHPFEPVDRAVIAVVGTFLALLYEWRKTLLAPILFHGMMNVIGMVAVFVAVAATANAPVLGVRGERHEGGCRLTEVVAGGAAADAGLRAGDEITAVGERPVKDQRDLVLIMRAQKVGDRIPVSYRRNGEGFRVEDTLKYRPQ